MSLETLLRHLADPSASPNVSQLSELSGLGTEATSAFADAWQEMELRRRRWLLDELIALAEDNVELNFDAVYLVALSDRDPDVRRDAIRGLWEHEGRALIDALIGMLEGDPDAAVRAEAALALGRHVIEAEFETLRAGDADRVERTLRQVFEDEAEIAEVRGRALESLGARSHEWVRDLISDAFEAADRRLRLSAIHAMGRSCDPYWLASVLEELASDDPEMRFEAAVAAGSIGDEEATQHLIPLLHDEDGEVRYAAIAALGEIGGDEAREALEELLEGADDGLREAVEAALADAQFAEDPLGFEARRE